MLVVNVYLDSIRLVHKSEVNNCDVDNDIVLFHHYHEIHFAFTFLFCIHMNRLKYTCKCSFANMTNDINNYINQFVSDDA